MANDSPKDPGRPMPGQPNDFDKDLGLGSRVTEESRTRFLNRDGSYNVKRSGLPFLEMLNPYHALLEMSWLKFNFAVLGAYTFGNIIFAVAYMLCGEGALAGGSFGQSLTGRFEEAFFFSVQTLSTIGYGSVSPHGLAANFVVAAEALTGLLGFALATGLLFARFSRPRAEILYSKNALVSPFRGGQALMFRIVNHQTNELIEVTASVTLSRVENKGGRPTRMFYRLELERPKVTFFPLHWVLVHPIDESSPLWGYNEKTFCDADSEVLVLINAIDETFSSTVYSRSSYKDEEVIWGAKFSDMFNPVVDGVLSVDLRKLDNYERVG
jgi:inward rectifier potassium channel